MPQLQMKMALAHGNVIDSTWAYLNPSDISRVISLRHSKSTDTLPKMVLHHPAVEGKWTSEADEQVRRQFGDVVLSFEIDWDECEKDIWVPRYIVVRQAAGDSQAEVEFRFKWLFGSKLVPNACFADPRRNPNFQFPTLKFEDKPQNSTDE